MYTTIGQQTEEMQGYRALLGYPHRALQSRILKKSLSRIDLLMRTIF
jgi:hypothetical protein